MFLLLDFQQIFICSETSSPYFRESNDFCFNFHNVQPMRNIHALYLRNYSLKGFCRHCYSTILDSMPNLNELLIEIHGFGAAMMNELLTKNPRLKILHLQCNLLDPELFFPPKNPLQPWLASLTNLEELELPFGWFEEKMLLTWPSMPKLKKLNLSYFKRSTENFVKLLQLLTVQCPNIVSFTIGEDDLCNDDLLPIVQGWPEIKYLNFIVTGTGFNHVGMKTIAVSCKKLRRLSFNADPNLFHEHNLEWQHLLYQSIPMLQAIEALDPEGDDWGSSTRDVYYVRQNIPAPLSYQHSTSSTSSDSTFNSVDNPVQVRDLYNNFQ